MNNVTTPNSSIVYRGISSYTNTNYELSLTCDQDKITYIEKLNFHENQRNVLWTIVTLLSRLLALASDCPLPTKHEH